MYIKQLDVSGYDDFDHHERVVSCVDPASGLHAFIAIHDRTLGPALGGCRMWPYATEAEAIKDVLRLSHGMTYKSAVAGLPLGGGKSVIMGNPDRDKTPAMMEAMGDFIDSLAGTYISAEDSGTSVEDLALMATRTQYVAGFHNKQRSDGTIASGDPSPSTAYGIFKGIEAAARFKLGVSTVSDVSIAIQGVGHVGRQLARLLHQNGARLLISDINPGHIEATLDLVQAEVIDSGAIHRQDVDIYAPCAMGGAISVASLAEIRAQIIAGAANNQLATPAAGDELTRLDKLYAPDYVINAGGIIDIYYERVGYDHHEVMRHLDQIGTTLTKIFELSAAHGEPTHIMADRLARERLMKHPASQVA